MQISECDVVLGGKRFIFNEHREERVVLRPSDFDVLLSLNTNNRPVNRKWVAELHRRLQDGRWIYNADPIQVSDSKILLNGQHRLHAFRRFGENVTCLVAFGLSGKAWTTYDTQPRRTLGQEMARHGIKNANGVAALARTIYRYLHRKFEGDRAVNVTMEELYELHMDGGLEHFVELARHQNLRKIAPPSYMAFLIWAGSQVLESSRFSEMYGVLVGSHPADLSHPIFLLKQKLFDDKASKRRMSQEEALALGIKSLNRFTMGQPAAKYLKWANRGKGRQPFPDIVGLSPLVSRPQRS
jgi:hypothetical protein